MVVSKRIVSFDSKVPITLTWLEFNLSKYLTRKILQKKKKKKKNKKKNLTV